MQFVQRLRQIHLASGVAVGGEQRGTHQQMVLRAMHPAEGQRHQFFQNSNGISGAFLQAKGDNLILCFKIHVISSFVVRWFSGVSSSSSSVMSCWTCRGLMA